MDAFIGCDAWPRGAQALPDHHRRSGRGRGTGCWQTCVRCGISATATTTPTTTTGGCGSTDVFQQPFVATHESMAASSSVATCRPPELAANLRRAFSGVVSGNIREEGIRAIEKHGPFEIRGDRAILAQLDGLLARTSSAAPDETAGTQVRAVLSRRGLKCEQRSLAPAAFCRFRLHISHGAPARACGRPVPVIQFLPKQGAAA